MLVLIVDLYLKMLKGFGDSFLDLHFPVDGECFTLSRLFQYHYVILFWISLMIKAIFFAKVPQRTNVRK